MQHCDDIYRFDSYWFGSFISSLEWSNPVLGSRRKGSREMPVNLYEFCIILLSIRCTMKLAAGPREINQIRIEGRIQVGLCASEKTGPRFWIPVSILGTGTHPCTSYLRWALSWPADHPPPNSLICSVRAQNLQNPHKFQTSKGSTTGTAEIGGN